jgi:regulator of sirC expression with transglutaminase-like and TPR domain
VRENLLRQFRAAIEGPDAAVDLFGGAMVIASLRDAPPVDAHGCARELDLLAEAVLRQADGARDTEALAHAVDHELFTVAGFHGNSTNYYEPENSFLDLVVGRRAGIPITLSLVYMEVAQRVGLECEGVGYPGHFIVRCGPPETGFYVDPFHQGSRIDRDELLAGLRGQDLNGATPESFLAAVTRRQVLQRMLHNLYAVFSGTKDLERLLDVVELLLCLEPWNADLVGERGILNYRLGNPRPALDDLERYVVATSGHSTVSSAALRALDELRIQLGREGSL